MLLTDALKIAAEKEKLDLGPYAVMYLVPSSKQTTMALSPTFITPPDWAITIGKKKINAAVAFGADRWGERRGHRVTIHEMGHIFGLPDLYVNTSDNTESLHNLAGSWDVMGNLALPPNFLVWHKWKLGWLDDNRIKCVTGKVDETFAIERNGATTGTQAVVIKTSPTAAYVVEVRARVGYDACQCSEGVLIYYVDAEIATRQGPVTVFPAQAAPAGACDNHVSLDGLGWAPYGTGEGREDTFDVDPNVTVTVQRTVPDGPATVRVKTKA